MTEEDTTHRPLGEQALTEVRSLRQELRAHGHTLSKWGRMLNALLALLEEKGIASKDEVLMKAYERLRDSGALERSESGGQDSSVKDEPAGTL